MAVGGAAGAAAAAAAARAAAEARRRAEEARRRAEEARKAAEAAKKAAEAAKQRAAQQQKKIAEHAKQLQAAVKKAAEKAQPKKTNEAATAQKTLEAQHKKDVADAQKLEQHAKQLAETAKKATDEASVAQKAAEEAAKTQKLTEKAKDLGEDVAQKSITDAAKALGKDLKSASVEEASKALGEALQKHATDLTGGAQKIAELGAAGIGGEKIGELGAADLGGKKIGELGAAGIAGKKLGQLGAAELGGKAVSELASGDKLGEAFGHELSENFRDALGKSADAVLKSPALAGQIRSASQNIGRGLATDSLQAVEHGLNSVAGDTLQGALKRSLSGSHQLDALHAAQTLDSKEQTKPKSAEEAGKQWGEKHANEIKARAEQKLGKPLNQVSETEADKALADATRKEAQHIPKSELEHLPGKGSPEEKAKQFAAAYGKAQRDTLATALGPKNAQFALNNETAHELGRTSHDTISQAAASIVGKKHIEDVANVAAKKAAPKPTPEESANVIRTAQNEGGNKAASEALRNQLAANRDPQFQKELVSKIQPEIRGWSKDLLDDDVTRGDQQTLRNLTEIGRFASPDVTKGLAQTFAKNFPPDTPANAEKLQRLNQFLLPVGAKSSAKAGSIAFLRETGVALQKNGNVQGSNYVLGEAKLAIETVQGQFQKQSDKVNELNSRLNNILGAAGPSLSPEDRQALIKRFHEKHADDYAKLNELAGPASSMLKEMHNSTAELASLKGNPNAQQLAGAQKSLLKDIPELAKTDNGKEAIRQDLIAQGKGEKDGFLQAAEHAKLGTEFIQKTQAALVEVVSGSALLAAKNGHPGEAKQLLEGLRQNGSLFGVDKDPKAFDKVITDLEGVAAGKKGAINDLAESSKGIKGGGGEALKGLGAALDIVGNIHDYTHWSQGDLQQHIETINSTLGLTGDAGKLYLDTIGSESKTLAGIFEGVGKVSTFFGGVAGALGAIDKFQKGDVFGGFLGAGSATLAIAGALGEVPGGQVISLAILGASTVKDLIDAHNEKQDRQAELKDLLQHTSLGKAVGPDVLDMISRDGDPRYLATVVNSAKAAGLDPATELKRLQSLSPQERGYFQARLEAQVQHGGDAAQPTPYDQALLKRNEGPRAVYEEADRQLKQPGLSDEERSKLENLKRQSGRIGSTNSSQVFDSWPFESPAAFGRDSKNQGYFTPDRQVVH